MNREISLSMKEDHHKISFVGEPFSGKTVLIKRLVHDLFIDARKFEKLRGNIDFNFFRRKNMVFLQTWDFPGKMLAIYNEEFIRAVFKNSSCFVLVLTPDNDWIVRNIQQQLDRWFQVIIKHAKDLSTRNENPKILLVIHKCDLLSNKEQQSIRKEIDAFTHQTDKKKYFVNREDICFVSSKEGTNFEDLRVRLEIAVLNDPVKLLDIYLGNQVNHGAYITSRLKHYADNKYTKIPALVVLACISLSKNDKKTFSSYLNKISLLQKSDDEDLVMVVNACFSVLLQNINTQKISDLEQQRIRLITVVEDDPIKLFSIYLEKKEHHDDVKYKLLQQAGNKENQNHFVLVALMLLDLSQLDRQAYAVSRMQELMGLEGHMSNGLPPSVNMFFGSLEHNKYFPILIKLKHDCIGLVINTEHKPLNLFSLFLKHKKTHSQEIKMNLLKQCYNNGRNFQAIIVLMLMELNNNPRQGNASMRLRFLIGHDACDKKNRPLSVKTFFNKMSQQKNLSSLTVQFYQQEVCNLHQQVMATNATF